MDIYCKDCKCPICGTYDEYSQPGDFICPQGCYSISSTSYFTDPDEVYKPIHVDHFKIFDEFFDIHQDETKEVIEEKINYWRENDKYLANILESK